MKKTVKQIYGELSVLYSCRYPDSLEEVELAEKTLREAMESDPALTEEVLKAKLEELMSVTDAEYRSKLARQVIGKYWAMTFITPLERKKFNPLQENQIEDGNHNDDWLQAIQTHHGPRNDGHAPGAHPALGPGAGGAAPPDDGF
jgi:hypothetical protein